MLGKAFNILKASAAASAEDESRSFANIIANKLCNCSSRNRSVVQHAVSNIIFDAYQGHFDQYCKSHNEVSTSPSYPPHASSSFNHTYP
jgi:hypothetical protein